MAFFNCLRYWHHFFIILPIGTIYVNFPAYSSKIDVVIEQTLKKNQGNIFLFQI